MAFKHLRDYQQVQVPRLNWGETGFESISYTSMNAGGLWVHQYQHYFSHCHHILGVVDIAYAIRWSTYDFSSKSYFIKNAQTLYVPLSTATQRQWAGMTKPYVDLLVFIVRTQSQKVLLA